MHHTSMAQSVYVTHVMEREREHFLALSSVGRRETNCHREKDGERVGNTHRFVVSREVARSTEPGVVPLGQMILTSSVVFPNYRRTREFVPRSSSSSVTVHKRTLPILLSVRTRQESFDGCRIQPAQALTTTSKVCCQLTQPVTALREPPRPPTSLPRNNYSPRSSE